MRIINHLNNVNTKLTLKGYTSSTNTLIFKLLKTNIKLDFIPLNCENMFKFSFDIDRLSYYRIDPEQRKQYSYLEMLFF